MLQFLLKFNINSKLNRFHCILVLNTVNISTHLFRLMKFTVTDIER